MGFRDASFEVVISSAVLHFARDRSHWEAMLAEMWRVLAPGGLFFARLATTIGIESEVEHLGGGRYRMTGGQELFLVDRELLMERAEALGASMIEPIKTTVVDALRQLLQPVGERADGIAEHRRIGGAHIHERPYPASPQFSRRDRSHAPERVDR